MLSRLSLSLIVLLLSALSFPVFAKLRTLNKPIVSRPSHRWWMPVYAARYGRPLWV